MTQKIWTVYAVSVGKKVWYIGVTSQDLADRLQQHNNHARRGVNTVFLNWLRKRIAKGAKVLITPLTFYTCKAEAHVAEAWTIETYRRAGCRLLNQSPGHQKMGKASKKRLSAAKLGKRRTHHIAIVETTTGRQFPTIVTAAQDLGLNQSSICQALKRGGTLYGYRFERVQSLPPANDNGQRPPGMVSPAALEMQNEEIRRRHVEKTNAAIRKLHDDVFGVASEVTK
jgi:GIY-YIG catalytic domain